MSEVLTETKRDVLSIPMDDEMFGGERFLLVWNIDPLGECCCPQGSRRWSVAGRDGSVEATVGGPGKCGSPGKHPWSPWVEGKRGGFAHGASDAVDLETLRGYPRARVYRPAVTLADVVVVDIDSERALRDFARIRRCIPGRLVAGVAKTPRGWHVYLRVAGWNQKALNLWLDNWLDDWHPTDERKVSRRGLVLDFRTGARRYVVLPDGGARRWAGRGEFLDAVRWAGAGIPPWRMVTEGEGRQAPWNLEMTPALSAHIGRYEAGAAADGFGGDGWADGPGLDLGALEAQLEMWCGRLAGMEPESGRNNALNRIAFFDGAACIRAGMARGEVEEKLRAAAAACDCPGAEGTIRSGLDSGLGS